MNDSKPRTCPRCGAAMPAGASEQACPACLMSGALEVPDPATTPREPPEYPRDFGGYRLLGVLGRGGMATVYDAEERATGRRVALKMLGQRLDSPDMRQRFLREGRLAAGVSHPNSLYVFGSEEVEGLPVITMEIADGGTLKDELERRGPLPTAEAVDATLDLIAGLEAAFDSGVLHRDIKPSNCFVSPDGSVKIGDYGLSVSTLTRDDSYATDSGVILGTPAFASPEQLRGDDLDARADIYSVGATLFTLLTDVAPIDGENVVQVVANALSQVPKPLSELREDVPPGLEKAVARCLAKEQDERFADYAELRDALLPFSSREPEPASLLVRASAGWIDYLIAFLVPYVAIMLAIGNEAFHFGFIMERTLYSARHYIAFLGLGLLYFTVVEGIWGAGLGKRLKGLSVVRTDGRLPGIGRALLRILIPVLCVEGIRVPIVLATITATHIDEMTTFHIVMYSATAAICPWIAVVLNLTARRENGFAAVWGLVSGTRVVVKPKCSTRPSIEGAPRPVTPVENADPLGPYLITGEIIPGKWIEATDPVLRRRVWMLRRTPAGLSLARRNLARGGRARWLQAVETGDGAWDAFEAIQGVPFADLVEGGKRVPWGTLRHWLHDLASELWAAAADRTLPAELSVDQVWITPHGQAVLLDEPWPEAVTPAERIPVGDIAGQQRFLNAVAAVAESTSLPRHARAVLRNLGKGTFEKLSFLAGTLRGILDRPAEVSRGGRAGSIFMFPFYVWLMCFLGVHQGADWLYECTGDSVARIALAVAMFVLVGRALIQIVELPLSRSVSHSVFGLAMVDADGEPAGMRRRLARWAIVWLPLLLPVALMTVTMGWSEGITFISTLVLLLLWICVAAHAVTHPNRGVHDRLAGTWVVRR
jgi:eukaryotic-like serine/threonine-protein kinase